MALSGVDTYVDTHVATSVFHADRPWKGQNSRKFIFCVNLAGKVASGGRPTPPLQHVRPQFSIVRCQLAPEATILEGYGITECSPVVAANRLDKVKAGTIGRPVRGVEALVVDPESHVPVAPGETGMLLVRGPSIFKGYHRHAGPAPFVAAAGGSWYRTGDLVSADADGYLTFRGRLKRFLKAGGEMISLPALEEPFQKRYPPDEDGPRVAVEGIETPDGRHVVLFTTFDLPLRAAAEILVADGLRGVMRLDEVRRLDRIPVLGTGKTDYTTLRRLVVEAEAARVGT